jgi:hypothetical protein
MHLVYSMDEQPVQLIGEIRVPIAATKDHPERVDYDNGSARPMAIVRYSKSAVAGGAN